jgi:hypothetical protein
VKIETLGLRNDSSSMGFAVFLT